MTTTTALVATNVCARCHQVPPWCSCGRQAARSVIIDDATPAKVTARCCGPGGRTRVVLRCEHSRTEFTFNAGLPMDEDDMVRHALRCALEQNRCDCLRALQEERKRDEE